MYSGKETRFIPLELFKVCHRLETDSGCCSTGVFRAGMAFFGCSFMMKIMAGQSCRVVERNRVLESCLGLYFSFIHHLLAV